MADAERVIAQLVSEYQLKHRGQRPAEVWIPLRRMPGEDVVQSWRMRGVAIIGHELRWGPFVVGGA